MGVKKIIAEEIQALPYWF